MAEQRPVDVPALRKKGGAGGPRRRVEPVVLRPLGEDRYVLGM
jgi:hypothetical protein